MSEELRDRQVAVSQQQFQAVRTFFKGKENKNSELTTQIPTIADYSDSHNLHSLAPSQQNFDVQVKKLLLSFFRIH